LNEEGDGGKSPGKTDERDKQDQVKVKDMSDKVDDSKNEDQEGKPTDAAKEGKIESVGSRAGQQGRQAVLEVVEVVFVDEPSPFLIQVPPYPHLAPGVEREACLFEPEEELVEG
jgi:hypothetical protein